MHPLAAPGTLWVLSRVGKYLVRPQADETSHKKQIPCGRQGKEPSLLFLFRRGFRLCGGDQGAFRSPPGPLRGPTLEANGKASTKTGFFVGGKGKRPFLLFLFCGGFRLCGGDQGAFRSPPGPLRGPPLEANGKAYKNWISCGRQGKDAFLAFPVSWRVSPLRRRPGGFPVAPLDPFGDHLLRRMGRPTKIGFFVGGKEKMFSCFFCFVEGFASAEATRGLSGRPPGPLREPSS